MSSIEINQVHNEHNRTTGVHVDVFPDECPLCHKGICPEIKYSYFNSKRWGERNCLEIVFKCPKRDCDNLFISYYKALRSDCAHFYYVASFPITKQAREFSKEIGNISKKFSIIYNQARSAEQDGLKEICGAGYRRALEFLIKDYLIKKLKSEDKPSEKVKKTTEDQEKKIKNKLLGKCISEDIENKQIKKVAQRAAWIGNDETHYIRIWEDKDLKDLKNLIELTVHWIEMEEITDKIEEDMPGKKKEGQKEEEKK